ncbi:hypothetical protein HKX48_005475 [Thoreauomyces humboldtii]|nr:hypothetical protein HKX48_005475 [Thoreauomyces humboldtii]
MSKYIKNVAIVGWRGDLTSGQQLQMEEVAQAVRNNGTPSLALTLPSTGAASSISTYRNLLLRGRKHNLVALTRAESTSKVPEGIRTVHVDYDQPATLVAALQGIDALVITMAVTAPRGQSEKLIRAAAQVSVPWVIPNEYGTDFTQSALQKDTLIGPPKAADRKLIEDLGVSSWIGVVCSFWYEYSLSSGPELFGFDFSKKSVTFYGKEEEVRINTSTFPQTGRAVAALLSLPIEAEDKATVSLSQFRNGPAYVSSFRVSQSEMLESVLRVTGDKRSDWTISYEDAAERHAKGMERMKEGDRLGFPQQLYARVFYPDGSGDYESRHGLDNEKLGLPKDDLDDATGVAVKMSGEKGLTLHLAESAGVLIFMKLLPDPFSFLTRASHQCISLLFSDVKDITPIPALDLHIRPMEGVAHTTGTETSNEIHFSSTYIASLEPSVASNEIRGVLVHEMVHVWQAYRTPAPHWIVEGVADYVRLRAGLGAAHWKRGVGGSWRDGYERTGFFLDWVETIFPGFVFELTRKPCESTVVEKTGESPDSLWNMYQEDLAASESGPASRPVPTHAAK